MRHPGQMKGANKAPSTPQEMIIFNAWQRFACAWNGRVWLRAHRDCWPAIKQPVAESPCQAIRHRAARRSREA